MGNDSGERKLKQQRAVTDRVQLIAGVELVLAIERCGSISDAAASLGLSQPAASRQLLAMEQMLGVPLFKRTTRTISPSDAGHLLVNSGKEMLRSADQLLELLRQSNSSPRVLKVTTGPMFGKKHILPYLQSFRDANPGVEIRLTLTDEKVDLVRDEVDLLLHIGHLPDRRLVAAKIGKQRRILCASPSYESRRGRIASPEDLARHPCLIHTRLAPTGVWHFWSGGTMRTLHVAGPMAANSSDILAEAACNGMGVTLLASWAVHEDLRKGKLVQLLPQCRFDSDAEPRDISFVWLPELSKSKQLRSFVTYFSQKFGKPPYWEV
ncbi:LysR family transcriptional regulator [Ramlibacter sp. WS9]|uniref:LysR family transcriptional regulator n=1 Tax=Ramlibacter sp. WS9 TaxID=1882741 RepID=UPI0011446D11|nr:LysR family transcriptional regulator [Ramlibacter sp. WS9]ROZ78109.1 LysR family transcriptional regulator [Ramlibacter sp. WS9]HSV36698.1 LysR family transcriptional regulator [Ramlibacter sp.]